MVFIHPGYRFSQPERAFIMRFLCDRLIDCLYRDAGGTAGGPASPKSSKVALCPTRCAGGGRMPMNWRKMIRCSGEHPSQDRKGVNGWALRVWLTCSFFWKKRPDRICRGLNVWTIVATSHLNQMSRWAARPIFCGSQQQSPLIATTITNRITRSGTTLGGAAVWQRR